MNATEFENYTERLRASLELFSKPVPDAAIHLLEIVERELKPKAPALAWDKVAIVRDWISEMQIRSD